MKLNNIVIQWLITLAIGAGISIIVIVLMTLINYTTQLLTQI